MLNNKKLNPVVTELFIRVIKLNTSLVFITESYFAAPKNIRLNSTHYFFMKVPNKQNFNKLHLIIFEILTWKTLWIFMKKCTAKPYSFLVIDATLALDNLSRFRQNLLKEYKK